MNKNRLPILILFLLFPIFGIFASGTVPEPPSQNPHPPMTQKDKERVAFAELAVS